jgi:DNA-binding GntR family transcriptional regulator
VHTELHPGALRSEKAYAELKGRLLAGDFRLGARLKETKLAALLDVSRTPVREALLRLHAEGLVTRQTDGGYIPVVPDVALIRSLYEVRSGLELQAIRRGSHDPATVSQLIDDWQGLADDEPDPQPAFVLLDEMFHIGLADAAGNPVLADVLRQINERIRAVRMVDFLTGDRITSTIQEHLDLAHAVLAGSLADAERIFVAHLDMSQAVVEQRVAAAITRMATAPDLEDEESA